MNHHPGHAWLLFRLVVALYLVASALSRYDATRLSVSGVAARLVLAVLLLVKMPEVAVAALCVTAAYLALHHLGLFRRGRLFAGRSDGRQ